MKNPSIVLPVLAAALLLPAAPASAQRVNLSAREALGLVSSQFGPQATQWIAEMRAQGGIPQPSDWQVLAYDSRAPRLLYRFWAGGGRAGDGGIDDVRYPDDVPVGYFTANQIGVDSVAAFTIAEGEARKARMAFDSCDYLLRLREYSSEPVWRLELLDATRRLVGKLYISATSGAVMRTIWVYRDQRARPDGLPLIIDSAAPGGQGAPVDLTRFNSTPSLDGFPPLPQTTAPALPPGAMTGIHSVPLPSAPGVAVNSGQPQTYAPVDPSGRPMGNDGIPAPPPLAQTPPAIAPAPATIPAPPAPSAPSAPAPPTSQGTAGPSPEAPKPPISAPSSGGGGNSERIPPPPIPR